tara:strand:+ start:132 stop:968 length:837 start_codon:yes stop_codon:yes gene_type:complete
MFTKNLQKRLTQPIDAFRKLGDTIDTPHGPLTHIDNGADILAVGHLDWVYWNPRPKITRQFENVRIEKTPQLDDRLGVWVILDVMRAAGINVDVLLCDSEEVGQSTAQYFETTKRYNWIVEFDRAGSGAVMYDFETPEYCEMLESVGYDVEVGSFTDICNLESLGVAGFNLGVGYHRQHTKKCYANLSETLDSFRKFQELHKRYGSEHLEHVPTPTTWWRTPAAGSSWEPVSEPTDDLALQALQDEYASDEYGVRYNELYESEKARIDARIDYDFNGA